MTEDPEHVARELIDAGPSEVPETLTAAWILRLIDEFAVTAADDMPDGERRFHTRFNHHLLSHIWDDMDALWKTEGGAHSTQRAQTHNAKSSYAEPLTWLRKVPHIKGTRSRKPTPIGEIPS